MKKIAIVYWSGTGNTQLMANAILEGVIENGYEGLLLTPSDFHPSMISSYECIAFGCPSMGSEVLEESEFEPMFSSCLKELNNKKIALFGSYGWGDGEWMRNWEDTCNNAGIDLICDSIICAGLPDSDTMDACKALVKHL